jgi:hypothetical protein
MHWRMKRGCHLGAVLLLPLAAQAHVSSMFDVKSDMGSAAIVCKVQVLSVSRPWIRLSGGQQTAKVKCLSTIKGTSPEKFEISFPAPAQMDFYTDLEKGEHCIVFLHGIARGMATFEDVDNGKMPCLGEVVPHNLGDSPQDRMLCELLAFCKASTGGAQLLAAEYLGQLGDLRAKTLLVELSKSADLLLRGVALAARIECGDAPTPEELITILNQDPAQFEHPASLPRFHVCPPTYHIMSALENSIKQESNVQFARPTAVLTNFDYVLFYTKAWDTRFVQSEPAARREMGSALRKIASPLTTPLLRKMLDDPQQEVRYFAVTALMRVYRIEHMPSVRLFAQEEVEYLAYWKDRLK